LRADAESAAQGIGAAREKEATKLTGVTFGGPVRGVLVREPIDFTTDQFRASIGWADARMQFAIAYIGSMFKNGTNQWLVEMRQLHLDAATTSRRQRDWCSPATISA
jgi:hypothetical protein